MVSLKLRRKLRSKLSGKLFYIVYYFYRIIKQVNFYFFRTLAYFFLFIPNLILKLRKECIIYVDGWGLGDLLSMTSFIEHYSRKYKVILYSSNFDIFKNLNVTLRSPSKIIKKLAPLIRSSPYSNIIGLFEAPLNMNKRKPHLRECLLNKRKDVCNELKKIKHNAIIKFSKEEMKSFSKKYRKIINKDYGIIVSGSYYGGYCDVKNWGKENFQIVINRTNKKIKWIQTGTKNEPLLKNIWKDFRGKTNLRELFFLVSKAKIIVTTEGMLTHLSSAFNVPCITIYSGFIYPELSKYDNVIAIQPNPLPKCAYCLVSPCINYSYPRCLELISTENVIDKINLVFNNKKIFSNNIRE